MISAFWRRIWMFKLFKQPYQSAQHDRMICKWSYSLHGDQNGTKRLSQPFEDRFWCSRCLNEHIKVPDMIGLFASSATTSLVARNKLENYTLLWIKSSNIPQIKSLIKQWKFWFKIKFENFQKLKIKLK